MEARVVTWRKSSYSGGNGGGCVEVAVVPGERLVRDSKNPDGGMIVISSEVFLAFISEIKDGSFDIS